MNFKMNFDETNQEFTALFEDKGNGGGTGKDGFSPIVEVEEIEGGNRVTITDKDGEKSFDVMDGKDGGYYAPFVVQDSIDSFTLGFEPNGEGMPGLPEFNIDLPHENFTAIYQKTTWAELQEAIGAGKHIYATSGDNVYVMISVSSKNVYFSRSQQTSIDYVILNSSDKWSSSSVKMSDAANIKFADGENLQDKYDNGKLGVGGGIEIKTFDLEAMGLPLHDIGEGYVEVATDTTKIVSALREGIARFEFMTNLGKVSAVCNQIYADGAGVWCVISSFYNEYTYGDFVIVVGEGYVTLLSNIRIDQSMVEHWILQSEYRIKDDVEQMIADALGAVENGSY